MTRNRQYWTVTTALLALLLVLCWSNCGAVDLKNSFFDTDLHKLRYGYASAVLSAPSTGRALLATTEEGDDFGNGEVKQKSPFKAFVLSAAVPGLGQYYYGSRIKPFVFLGAEVAAWGLYFKFHGDGVDQEDAFEAFNREHWSQYDYEQRYLLWAYGETDDDLLNETEISHHLPDTRTQQYYEMTGKYDQFAWGWDDATYHDSTLSEFGPSNPPPRITNDSFTPVSARREVYEDMRHEANQSFDKATKMIIASIANRLISAFEAYFATKNRNEKAHRSGSKSEFGEFKFSASLKSLHSKRDTPYVKVTYKF